MTRLISGNRTISPCLRPRTVAVIALGDTPGSGQAVFANLLAGVIGRVSGQPESPRGGRHAAVPNVKMLEPEIDLAVVTTAIRSLPGVMKDCAKKRSRPCCSPANSPTPTIGKRGEERITISPARWRARVLGPNMLGPMRPVIGPERQQLFRQGAPGNLALVAHLGAVHRHAGLGQRGGLLVFQRSRWAKARTWTLAKSSISGGRRLHPGILLHALHPRRPPLHEARLRAAARGKPVVVIKSGRYLDQHTGPDPLQPYGGGQRRCV